MLGFDILLILPQKASEASRIAVRLRRVLLKPVSLPVSAVFFRRQAALNSKSRPSLFSLTGLFHHLFQISV